MLDNLLGEIECKLDKIGQDLWDVDGPDDALDKVLEKLSSLKAQVEVQKALQTTANLLRQQPHDKALPKQQATKVKHLIRFVFRKESRGGDRHRQLRDLDCDALKFCGLSYTTEEIVKMEDAKFNLLQSHSTAYIHSRKLSHLLYRPDVDKAVDAKLEDPDDESSFDMFIQSHTARRQSTRKRKYAAIASPNEAAQRELDNLSIPPADSEVAACDEAGLSQVPTEERTNTEPVKYGDVFALSIDDARWALSSGKNVTEVFLTNPWTANKLGKKPSFLTAWLSEDLGEFLSKQAQPINY